jgi:hypothetical protein
MIQILSQISTVIKFLRINTRGRVEYKMNIFGLVIIFLTFVKVSLNRLEKTDDQNIQSFVQTNLVQKGKIIKIAVKAAGKAGKKVGEAVKKGAQKVGRTAKRVGKKIVSTAKKAGKAVGRGAKKAGKAVVGAAKATGRFVKRNAGNIAKAAAEVADALDIQDWF